VKPSRLLPSGTRRRLNINRHRIGLFAARAAAEIPAGARVLDAGAGEGDYRALFARHRYVSADLAVGDADWDYGALSTICDLHRMPFAPGTFDAAVATQVLEHLLEPGRFLEEVHASLRPGGTLYLTAPMMFKEHQAPHDYWRFTRHGLRHLLERAGFRVVSIEAQGGYFWLTGDQIQAMHRYLFSNRRALLWRALFLPLEVVSKLFFSIAVPWVCYRLDGLDRKRTYTTGFECVAVREKEATA
jgi:SAM-dependent methyltransferase